MSVNPLNSAYSGLRANAYRADVSANNVANLNTDGFKSSDVRTADAAYINNIGQGTQVTGTYTNARPGPPAIDMTGGQAEQSNTDPVAEVANMMSARAAYGANVSMASTANDVARSVLDIKG